MELPVHIAGALPRAAVISVDGAWGAPGLNLSHWPGHRTPRELRHDLSTGSALAFARLAPEARCALARGASCIVNNHFDTDGTCALFAVRHPALALELERELLDAARCGDLFAWPSERAFQVDCIVAAFGDDVRSPLASEFAGLDDEGRWTRATLRLHELMPQLLRADLGPFEALWGAQLARAREDRADLALCRRDDLAHLDWSVFSGRAGLFRAGGGPGRHALFGASELDRVLVALACDGGTLYRFVINTTSWFDLVTRTALPRPSLSTLARRLNELEGSDPAGECAWRAQESASPSPELWFGGAEHPRFAEHCAALRPSRLALAEVRRELAEAQRSALALPES
ncbi:MAG: hypothetical protein IT454_08580 [Planctomycetes bacterium]|nr:hypothetical protein [Planctomycetota bacterium]